MSVWRTVECIRGTFLLCVVGLTGSAVANCIVFLADHVARWLTQGVGERSKVFCFWIDIVNLLNFLSDKFIFSWDYGL